MDILFGHMTLPKKKPPLLQGKKNRSLNFILDKYVIIRLYFDNILQHLIQFMLMRLLFVYYLRPSLPPAYTGDTKGNGIRTFSGSYMRGYRQRKSKKPIRQVCRVMP